MGFQKPSKPSNGHRFHGFSIFRKSIKKQPKMTPKRTPFSSFFETKVVPGRPRVDFDTPRGRFGEGPKIGRFLKGRWGAKKSMDVSLGAARGAKKTHGRSWAFFGPRAAPGLTSIDSCPHFSPLYTLSKNYLFSGPSKITKVSPKSAQ